MALFLRERLPVAEAHRGSGRQLQDSGCDRSADQSRTKEHAGDRAQGTTGCANMPRRHSKHQTVVRDAVGLQAGKAGSFRIDRSSNRSGAATRAQLPLLDRTQDALRTAVRRHQTAFRRGSSRISSRGASRGVWYL